MRALLLVAVLGVSIQAEDERETAGPNAARTDAARERAIRRGVEFLKSDQASDGRWRVHSWVLQDSMHTAHALWALAANGVPVDDPAILRGLAWTQKHGGGYQPGRVFATRAASFLLIALTRLDATTHRRRIHKLARRLERAQRKHGMWGGMLSNGSSPDKFNSTDTLCATLALWTAEQYAGYEPNPRVWNRMLRHFIRSQEEDGGWGDWEAIGGWRNTLTATALFALVVSKAALKGGPGALPGARETGAARRGRDALVQCSSYKRVRTGPHFLFGLDCAATFTDMPESEWYWPRARRLIAIQGKDGGWGVMNRGGSDAGDTARVLVFLSRAVGFGVPRRPGAVTPKRDRTPAVTAPKVRFPEAVRPKNLESAFEAYLTTAAADRAPFRPRFATAGRVVIGFFIERLGDPELQVRTAAHELMEALLARTFPFDPTAPEPKRREMLQPILDFWEREGEKLTWNAELGKFERG